MVAETVEEFYVSIYCLVDFKNRYDDVEDFTADVEIEEEEDEENEDEYWIAYDVEKRIRMADSIYPKLLIELIKKKIELKKKALRRKKIFTRKVIICKTVKN